MARMIKFRQPIFQHGKFSYFYDWGYIDGEFVEPLNLTYMLYDTVPIKDRLEAKEDQQYTGLKDKNGVEIYEGDITCRHWDNGTWQNGIIIYDEASFLWQEIGGTEKHRLGFIHPIGINTKHSEVIGNIHENPELNNST